MAYIFTKAIKDGQHQVRLLGHEFFISEDEANRAIETGQGFYKANKLVRSLSELKSVSTVL